MSNTDKTDDGNPRPVRLGALVLTADAAFTQRDVCAAVVAGGGHYVFPVKDNQSAPRWDIAARSAGLFPPAERAERAERRAAIRVPADPGDDPAE